MKNIITLFAMVAILFTSFGQAPGSMKYQAVLRNTSNVVLNNQTVDMQFTIYNSLSTSVWTQTYNVTSNDYGLVNIDLGPGLDTISWDADAYTIETAIDFQDGNGMTVMGSSPVLSVPYALHAATADSIIGDDGDWTVNANDMYSTPSGNVGIGVAAPNEKLDVDGNMNASGMVYSGTTDNVFFRDTVTPYWNGFHPNPACPTCPGVGIENGDSESGGFWANGNVATIWSPGDDYILRIYDEDGFPNPTSVQAYLDGSSGTPANWNAGAYNTISDMRIKENFRSIQNPLERLLELNTYQYDIREDIAFKNELALGKEISEETRNMLKNQLGFKAQELNELFPGVVHYSEGFQLYTVNYDMMVPVLVEGVKEQQQIINDLQTENKDLKLRMLKMEERLNALENQ